MVERHTTINEKPVKKKYLEKDSTKKKNILSLTSNTIFYADKMNHKHIASLLYTYLIYIRNLIYNHFSRGE